MTHEKWQKKWKEERIFEPKIGDSKPFFITVAYPYANSALHIGHGRTFVSADIIARFQRAMGKNVLYPMGFHASGTPVLAVADGVKRKDPTQMELTKNAIACYIDDEQEQQRILETFTDPKAISDFFTKQIEKTFDAVGMSVDWTRKFTTEERMYQKFVQWQYHHLEKNGILSQGRYPILYSVADKNAVGEDDIKDGDVDKVSIQEMTYIKFKLSDAQEYLVAATLRADSLFGATNLYVKPSMQLCKVSVNGEIWVVSKVCYEKLQHQFDSVKLISEHSGSEFIGKEVIVPITKKQVPIQKMEYPDENHGTGIVYSSPADSPHDYIYLFELTFPGKKLSEFETDPLKLTPITQTKDKKGNDIVYKDNIPAFDKLHKFGIYQVEGNDEKLEQAKEELYREAHYGARMINCGLFDGLAVKHGQKAVENELQESNLGGIFYETSRRAVTRAGNNVIVANLHGQWFLDYSQESVKQKAYDVFDNMSFRPSRLEATQKGYLSWVQKRPCARKRGLGTPLPQDPDWVIEPLSDSTIYQMLYLISHIITHEQIKPEQLTQELLDYVYLNDGNVSLISEDTKISPSVIKQMRESVSYWKAVDVRYTNPPHMSNHLSFLIYHYGLIFPKENWPKNITVAGLLIKDGHKISKSKGNGIPLIQVPQKYGIDLYRLYTAIGATYESEMDFREEEIEQLGKRFEYWKTLVTQASQVAKKEYDSFDDTDKWLISQFYKRAQTFVQAMEECKFREGYIQILYEFMNDMTYHTSRKDSSKEVLRFILEDYMILMCPAIPHFAEDIYSQIAKGFVSVTAFKPKPEYIDDTASEIIVQELVSLIRRQQEMRNIESLKSITIYQANETKFTLFNTLKDLLSETKDFKKIMSTLLKDFSTDATFIKKFVPKTLGDGVHAYISREDEKSLLEKTLSWFKEEFNCDVSIKNDNMQKVGQALPARPSILIE